MKTITSRRTLGLALSTFLLAGVAPLGCASGTSIGNEEETSSAAQAIIVPEYRAYWDYAGADLDAATTSARNAGFHPIPISAYGTADAPRYAAVFVKRPTPLFHVVRGTGLASFQAAFNAQASQSFKPALLSFDGDANNPVWAASFVASTTGIPYTRAGLSLSATDMARVLAALNVGADLFLDRTVSTVHSAIRGVSTTSKEGIWEVYSRTSTLPEMAGRTSSTGRVMRLPVAARTTGGLPGLRWRPPFMARTSRRVPTSSPPMV